MIRDLFLVLREAAELARASGGGPRVRRLLAEVDLLRAAVAVASVDPACDEDVEHLGRLVHGVREEALELHRGHRLARESAAQMMD